TKILLLLSVIPADQRSERCVVDRGLSHLHDQPSGVNREKEALYQTLDDPSIPVVIVMKDQNVNVGSDLLHLKKLRDVLQIEDWLIPGLHAEVTVSLRGDIAVLTMRREFRNSLQRCRSVDVERAVENGAQVGADVRCVLPDAKGSALSR